MTPDDPFLTLLVEALNLIHPRFAAAYPLHEFYHQFRRLWDKALPVQLGLGHVILQADPDIPAGNRPDLFFWQLGEHGQPDRRLGAVSLITLSNPAEFNATLKPLDACRTAGYAHAVCVVLGRTTDLPEAGLQSAEGVTTIFYDTDRRTATTLD